MRLFAFAAALALFAAQASAWHFDGCVYCDKNGNGIVDDGDTPVPGVFIVITGDGGFYDTETTGADGCYSQGLPDWPAKYQAVIDTSSLPEGAKVLLAPGGTLDFEVDYVNDSFSYDWLIDCGHDTHDGACWLTGGGAKYCSITGTYLATGGPPDGSFGGNVYPSCDPDPGHGGNWNHIDHANSLHFQGTDIEVVRCGNVDGIPTGSESPKTPVNFIEFKGTGKLKGIKSNKSDYGTVYFFARCEDRNEPGSHGAKDGAKIDRYFLHVFSNPADPYGSTLLLVDIDRDPKTVDPLTISGGNLQIHASSCDDPPAWAK